MVYIQDGLHPKSVIHDISNYCANCWQMFAQLYHELTGNMFLRAWFNRCILKQRKHHTLLWLLGKIKLEVGTLLRNLSFMVYQIWLSVRIHYSTHPPVASETIVPLYSLNCVWNSVFKKCITIITTEDSEKCIVYM